MFLGDCYAGGDYILSSVWPVCFSPGRTSQRLQRNMGSWQVLYWQGGLQFTHHLVLPVVAVSIWKLPKSFKPHWVIALFPDLNCGVGIMLENAAQSSHHWHVKEMHVAPKPLSVYHWIWLLTMTDNRTSIFSSSVYLWISAARWVAVCVWDFGLYALFWFPGLLAQRQ